MQISPHTTETTSFRIADQIRVGGDAPLFFIAGPCGLESRDLAFSVAETLRKVADRTGIPWIFKSSYDKANRTSITSFRGPGLEEGLSLLEDVKQEFGVPVTSDIHCRSHAKPASDVLDLIQIPAFLSRQTDMILAAAETGTPINVKKGQFLNPENAHHIVEKAQSTGHEEVVLTERGNCFGYGDLVVDMGSIPVMQKAGIPVIFDATHSAQRPGAGDGETTGNREIIPTLARSAVAAGCNGVFLETHTHPEKALSDAATQLPVDHVEPLITSLQNIRSSLDLS